MEFDGISVVPVKIMPTYEEVEANNGSGRDYPNTEFSSPTHVTPLFTTLAAAVPTPKFSESVRISNFILHIIHQKCISIFSAAYILVITSITDQD